MLSLFLLKEQGKLVAGSISSSVNVLFKKSCASAFTTHLFQRKYSLNEVTFFMN